MPVQSGLLALLAAAEALPIPYARDIPLLECHVAGTRYRALDPSLVQLAPGQEVRLQREPENPHDTDAIRVETVDGVHLGYVPRRRNEVLARLMDAGKLLIGRVVAVEWSDGASRLRVGVVLRDA